MAAAEKTADQITPCTTVRAVTSGGELVAGTSGW